MVVAERIDGDPGHEVEVAGPVVGDQLDAVPSHEQGADARIHAEQRLRGRRGGHAG